MDYVWLRDLFQDGKGALELSAEPRHRAGSFMEELKNLALTIIRNGECVAKRLALRL
jgi:hypothetical protein